MALADLRVCEEAEKEWPEESVYANNQSYRPKADLAVGWLKLSLVHINLNHK